MSLFKLPNDLCDVVSAFVYCTADGTVMLTIDVIDYWIISSVSQPGESWQKSISKDLDDIFGPLISVNSILRLYKIWVPNHSASNIFHCVFLVNVNSDAKKKSRNALGKYRGKLRWVNEAELVKCFNGNNLKSPEIYEYFYLARKQTVPNFIQPSEITIFNNIYERCEQEWDKNNKCSPIVEGGEMDKKSQDILYKEFVWVCFPAAYMSIQIFLKFLLVFGWSKDQATLLFRAADINGRNGLSFKDFLFFLIAVDPNTVHGAAAAEIRCKYIFKYMDSDNDSMLNPVEFRNYVVQSRKARKLPLLDDQVDKEVADTYKALNWKENYCATLNDFLKGAGEGKIQGAQQMLRSIKTIQHFIKDVIDRDSRVKKSGTAPAIKSAIQSKVFNDASARFLQYDLAVHTIRIQRSGQAINIDELQKLEDAISLTTIKQPVNEETRRISMNLFSQKSITNELLKGMRYLVQLNKRVKNQKPNFSWGQLDPQVYSRKLISVCTQVKDILRLEPRLMALSSPVYVMGDLHGNVSDLLYFERVLWHIGPGLCPCSLLFLGDYVDRGAYSIEVISYLFANKLQSPLKITLLRGNHEIREVQKMFTFYGECILKFGEKLGNEVWMAINDVFDVMPIAATIDKKVFCCHGGVPPPWLCPVINAINDIPVPLCSPDVQSSLAWELMWNDPVRSKTVNDKLAMELLANEGFALNTRRGTAHIFSVEALERFLKANQLTHFVRAHEVAQAGFNVQQKGKLLTVFSSSKYCGGQNEAACILIDQGKLRILRLETD